MDGIFISQDKYVVEILRKFGLTEGKSASTPIDTEKPLLKDPNGEDIDIHTYRSMISSLMYLTSSRPDIMFACKKQTVVVTSSTKAEYVAAASCCCKKQTVVVTSSTKAEYVAATSCCFWNTVVIKQTNDDTRLQALVDKKKVVVTEATIRELLIRNQLGDLSTYTTKYTSPALTQKVFANMRRVGKGFSGVKTPLFEGMIVEQVIEEEGTEGEHVEEDTATQGDDTTAQEPSKPSPTPPTPPPQPPHDLPSSS
nr:hypothetical protein [Tanacetum cinerariifolium]